MATETEIKEGQETNEETLPPEAASEQAEGGEEQLVRCAPASPELLDLVAEHLWMGGEKSEMLLWSGESEEKKEEWRARARPLAERLAALVEDEVEAQAATGMQFSAKITNLQTPTAVLKNEGNVVGFDKEVCRIQLDAQKDDPDQLWLDLRKLGGRNLVVTLSTDQQAIDFLKSKAKPGEQPPLTQQELDFETERETAQAAGEHHWVLDSKDSEGDSLWQCSLCHQAQVLAGDAGTIPPPVEGCAGLVASAFEHDWNLDEETATILWFKCKVCGKRLAGRKEK